jgi:lysophospholipase L1-like esterase
VAAAIHLGIIGDSLTDEYRADDNRGGSYSASTFNWVELLQRYKGVDPGTWGTYASPRRTGYAYNWALSGATSTDAVSSQIPGLAQQVRNGQVDTVIIMIGINDFSAIGDQIYDGSLSGSALQQRSNAIVSNIMSCVDTIRSAGNAKIIVSNIPEYLTYVYRDKYTDPVKRQRIPDAYSAANSAIASAVAARLGVVLFDNYAALTAWLASRDSNGDMHVGNELITWATNGDEAHHAFLVDQHPGTVNQGLYANAFINVMNSVFGINLVPFSDQELLANAGIRTSDNTPPAAPRGLRVK